MATYRVQVDNKSKNAWKFFVYQRVSTFRPLELTVAWLASSIKIPSGFTTHFIWQHNYQFVWGTTRIVEPGTIFTASGQVNCDPQDANTTTFAIQDGIPGFSQPVSGSDKGTLRITEDKIPIFRYAVGIGMSQSATYVVNAEPNLTHVITPLPGYYIAAIDEVKQGEVMDVKTITKTAEIKFLPGWYNMTATFQADDTWSITPSSVGQEAKVPHVDQVAKGSKAQVK